MTKQKRIYKRLLDILISLVGIIATWWIIIIAFIVATVDTRKNGFFIQERIGLNGKLFKVIKIRTMRGNEAFKTSVTASNDPRITKCGSFFRKTKIDELPQLVNVLLGQMSLVGPRPDVPGYADALLGGDRIVLSIRPGITGPATIKYRNEEEILALQPDPERYNLEVIFPDKVKINRRYVENYNLIDDLRYIKQTIIKG